MKFESNTVVFSRVVVGLLFFCSLFHFAPIEFNQMYCCKTENEIIFVAAWGQTGGKDIVIFVTISLGNGKRRKKIPIINPLALHFQD